MPRCAFASKVPVFGLARGSLTFVLIVIVSSMRRYAPGFLRVLPLDNVALPMGGCESQDSAAELSVQAAAWRIAFEVAIQSQRQAVHVCTGCHSGEGFLSQNKGLPRSCGEIWKARRTFLQIRYFSTQDLWLLRGRWNASASLSLC